MSNPTAPVAARPASAPSLFVPEGGCTWVPVPVGLDGPGLLVWAALMRCRRGLIVTAPDRVLAQLCKRSTRYVQLGLRQLEAEKLIGRTRRHGRRMVTILVRLAGGRAYAPGGREYARSTHRKPASPPIRTPVVPPSYGGERGNRTAGPPIDRPAIDGPVRLSEAARAFLIRLPAFAPLLS